METTFFAILEDEQTVIEKPFFELISSIPSTIKYLFKAQYIRPFSARYRTISEFIYTPIDSNGGFITLDLPDFTILGISPDKPIGEKMTRTVTVSEKRSGQIRKHIFNADLEDDGESFLVKTLIPYINKLKMIPSWEVFDKLEQYDSMKIENEDLKLKIIELESKLKECNEQV